MDSSRWDRLQALFYEARTLPSSEWRAYLLKACEGDEGLAAETLAMLDEDASRASLLDESVAAAAKALLSDESRLPTDFGPYRITKLLGEGGMGAVYLGERKDIGGPVAVKILSGALSPQRRKRFAREESTLAQLNHPSIARIYDAGILSDGTPWFVMEYIEGVPITQYCRQHGKSVEARLRLFRSVCEAVRHAHGKAIIHRDLKPSNILVKADGSVKLLDFGIAKQLTDDALPQEQTQTWLRMLTPAYAAPEQMRGDPPSTQMDVYSLGVLLYELLTSNRPFELSKKTLVEAEQTVMKENPELPSSVARRMSERHADESYWSERTAAWRDLDVLCLTAMHKDVERRYPSVEALMRECDHFLLGEPLEARPDTLFYRADKFVRRNRRPLLTMTATLLTLLTMGAFFTVRLARAYNAERTEARRTQRIEQFMLNLFYGGDQTAGPSADLRVMALLDRGVKDAETLQSDPAVQAEVHQTLGNVYQKIGKFDQADALMLSALAERTAFSGADSREVAESLTGLSLLRVDQAKVDEAERLAKQALAIAKELPEPRAPSLARAMFALGRVLEERGANDEAIRLLEEAVRIQSASGENTPALSDSLNALGIAHYYKGRFAEAESVYQRSLAMDRVLYGSLHPRVAEDLVNLGEIQASFRRWSDAELYYRQALAIEQSWHGKDHPDTATCMAGIGNALTFQGRFDEAAQTLQEALAVQERIYGKSHPQVAIALNMLGALEMRRGRLDDAEKDFLRMEVIDRSVYGEKHRVTITALEQLGEIYRQKKEFSKAESYFRRAVQGFAEIYSAGHPDMAIAHLGLGRTLLDEQKYQEAELHLLEAYEFFSKQSALGRNFQDTCGDLITLYEALREPDKASRFRAELARAGARNMQKASSP
ncbi:MAG: tetratricopeptide repeat protein [Acidobacteriia bacterium]|nr:tetratricopeptide repeat protein [Terriglobia bacterium]